MKNKKINGKRLARGKFDRNDHTAAAIYGFHPPWLYQVMDWGLLHNKAAYNRRPLSRKTSSGRWPRYREVL